MVIKLLDMTEMLHRIIRLPQPVLPFFLTKHTYNSCNDLGINQMLTVFHFQKLNHFYAVWLFFKGRIGVGVSELGLVKAWLKDGFELVEAKVWLGRSFFGCHMEVDLFERVFSFGDLGRRVSLVEFSLYFSIESQQVHVPTFFELFTDTSDFKAILSQLKIFHNVLENVFT